MATKPKPKKNKYSHLGGRPPKFTLPSQIWKKALAYFLEKEKSILPKTVSGLCIALGITRTTLGEYKRSPRFTHIVKMALLVIEEDIIVGAMVGKWESAPAIFNLKANFQWIDKPPEDKGNDKGDETSVDDSTSHETLVGIIEEANRIARGADS